MPFQLSYRSRSIYPRGHLSDLDILRVAIEVNRRLDITGYLIRESGQFAQVLEGCEDKVRDLFHKISRDPRHDDVQVLGSGQVPTRLFSGWSMGYSNLGNSASISEIGNQELIERVQAAARAEENTDIAAGG